MEILQIVLTAATGSGVTAIILAILQRKWTKDDKRDAIVDALKVLLIDRVRYQQHLQRVHDEIGRAHV